MRLCERYFKDSLIKMSNNNSMEDKNEKMVSEEILPKEERINLYTMSLVEDRDPDAKYIIKYDKALSSAEEQARCFRDQAIEAKNTAQFWIEECRKKEEGFSKEIREHQNLIREMRSENAKLKELVKEAWEAGKDFGVDVETRDPVYNTTVLTKEEFLSSKGIK